MMCPTPWLIKARRGLKGVVIFRKNSINIAHLPTLMLAIGYPLYWAQMMSASAPDGITSPAAWILFGLFAFWIIQREWDSIGAYVSQWRQLLGSQELFLRAVIVVGLALGAFIVGCAFLGALHPPHLMQETDMMNYHMTLARQHLILGSFAHIPWSGSDLFYMPIDFALAPFWFVTALPNKIPQFLFFLGIVGVLLSLAHRLNPSDKIIGVWIVFAFLGSHGHGIQMGTAMLDLPLAYLFCAMIDSFLRRQKWLLVIEAVFFLWAKSLVALQIAVLALAVWGIYGLWRWMIGPSVYWDFRNPLKVDETKEYGGFLKNVAQWIAIVSLAVAGPFMAKSIYYAGTPFYPVGAGWLNFHPGISEQSGLWSSLMRCAEFLNTSIHRDGYGRSMLDFLTHFWSIAVPSSNVNNAFDYPLGLTYLILLLPFLVQWSVSIQQKRFCLMPWLIVCYWMLWWLTVRETRHLYAPVLLMFLVTILNMRKISRVLGVVILVAMMVNAINVYRAHGSYFLKSSYEVLREEDRLLVDLSREYRFNQHKGFKEVPTAEAAFALFPVTVRREFLPHALGSDI